MINIFYIDILLLFHLFFKIFQTINGETKYMKINILHNSINN